MSNNKQSFKDGYQPRTNENPNEGIKSVRVKNGYQPTKSEGTNPTNPPPKRK